MQHLRFISVHKEGCRRRMCAVPDLPSLCSEHAMRNDENVTGIPVGGHNINN